MSDNFRHITPFDLPEHLPDANLWNNIEDKLDEIDARASYESLPIHKPSTTVWNNIEAGINTSWANHWNKIWYGGIAIALLLSLLFIKDYHQASFLIGNKMISKKIESISTDHSIITKDNDKQGSNSPIHNSTLTPTKEKNKNLKSSSNNSEKTASKKQNTYNEGEDELTNSQKENLKPIIPSDNRGSETTNNKDNRNSNILFERHFANFITLQNRFSLKQRKTNYFDYTPQVNIEDKKYSICSTRPEKNRKERKKIHAPNLNKLFYDIHYSKEAISQNYSYSDQRKANSFGINLGYKVNSTFFQTGLNFNFVEDLAFYKIDYLKNELVRTYLETDSIIYLPDPMTGVIEKEYLNFKEKEYDSISYSASKNVLSNYTYLRLPLVIGYQYKYSKLSVSASIGTEFSTLIQGKEPTPNLEINDTRVVRVKQTASSVQTIKWQMLAGLSMEYPINTYLKIKIESQYRGEWGAYTKTQTTTYVRPYTISLKTGILINF